MVFSSMTFLYYFLPAVLLIYFVVPAKGKNVVLLISSLIFYGWGESRAINIAGHPVLYGYVLFMLLTILVGYLSALVIEKYKDKVTGRITLIIALFCCLLGLGFFKYANFFIEIVAGIIGVTPRLLDIALPIGISFYTFQLISYVVDVYRGQVKAIRNPITLYTYVIMFPQLIAGPIVRYSDVEQELSHRTHSIPMVREGIVRFVIGLGKKVLIANQLGALVDVAKSVQENSVTLSWVCAIAAALQIYFDFSGYSDMAIGLGRILGFRFPENFDYPYVSKSITEFWRRWHMTLGGWFRDYVYIPMGGSRVGKGRLIFNLLVVWSLTGLWHGATMNFVVWGLFFGVLLIIEKLFILSYLQKAKGINHIYVLMATVISFVIFSCDTLGQAGAMLKNMFGMGGLSLMTKESLYHVASYGFTLFVAIIGATPLVKKIAQRAMAAAEKYKLDTVLESVVLALILILSTAHIVDGSFNPFLYFRF
ncbi:MAG: MBOAT family protein [Lachnospiraceae bacterium]|nr:MBOAT family protein [Lachnospiraceae bacterium]